LKSNALVALISIGEAARTLGMNASALRYYEERGLIRSVSRRSGKRMYDAEQLRRLVLVQIMQQLGIPLDAAAAILDENGDTRRAHLAEQIRHLEELIARAGLARDFLSRARNCRTDHPVAQCPKLGVIIDRRLSGVSFDQLVREHTAKTARSDGSAGRARPSSLQ
jgi:DNA-binding transcriptional MerR regulator